MARPEKKPFELRGFPPALMARCFTSPLPVAVVWVEDGDSVRGVADNGRGHYELEDFRLDGIDAWDAGKKGKTAADERASQVHLAKLLGFDLEAAERRVEEGDTGELVVAHALLYTAPGRDKYGRWLIRLESAEGVIVNDQQVTDGFAVYWNYG